MSTPDELAHDKASPEWEGFADWFAALRDALPLEGHPAALDSLPTASQEAARMTNSPTLRLLPRRSPVALAGLAFGACLLASAAVSAQTAPWTKPAPTATWTGAGFGLRLDHTVFPRAGVEQTRGYVGVMFRPIAHLAFDVGIGFGGGRWRRPWAVDSFATFDATLDARLYLNPRSPLQLFILGGVGTGFVSASTSLTPSVTPGDCPGDAMMFYDLSGGLGAELRLGRHGSLLATARLVRRSRFAGELTFATESVNPPLTARDEALGASLGIALVGYFSR